MDVWSLKPVDGLIAGPPCPPWSASWLLPNKRACSACTSKAIGKRRRFGDPRSLVLDKVTQAIVAQGHKGCKFFILEQVAGWSTLGWAPGVSYSTEIVDRLLCSGHTPKGEASSPMHAWLEDLSQSAPMWHVFVFDINSRDYVPQNRPRIYLAGLNKHCFAAGVPRILALPRPTLAPSPLQRWLHAGAKAVSQFKLSRRSQTRGFKGSTPMVFRLSGCQLTDRQTVSQDVPCPQGLPPIDESRLSSQQRLNLIVAKAHLQAGHVLTVSLDRSPARTWGQEYRADGLVCTLRTANGPLWLLATDAWQEMPPVSLLHEDTSGQEVLSRELHPLERLALQGLPPVVGSCLTRQAFFLPI